MEEILKYFPEKIELQLQNDVKDFENLEEIRFRVNILLSSN